MVRELGLTANIPSSNAFETWNKVLLGPENGTDTTLRLNSPATSSLYASASNSTKRKRYDANRMEGSERASLVLGLGPFLSSSDNTKGSSVTVSTMSSGKETEVWSSRDLDLNFNLYLGSENMANTTNSIVAPQKACETGPIFDLQLTLSTGQSSSATSSLSPASAQHQNSSETSAEISAAPTVDEGSVSSQLEFGSCLGPSLYVPERTSMFPPNLNISVANDPVPDTSDFQSTMISMLKSPVACTSGVTDTQRRNSSLKNCRFPGCGKGARGASGLCIAHGGGRRCQKAGCHKGAEGRTIYCKAHGGGRRCLFLGCTKSAEGRTEYCIAHGGGKRCSHEGCSKAARGKSGLCIRHGGGKRCQRENCTKSAEGYSGLCISHGGGRRCQYPDCTKGAQGSTRFCKAHGGGKRCTIPGCTKGAEGSTPFCKAHGGGKRCSFQGGGVCPKSVHGGTQFCVAHGGGKRCAVPECTKSARGRTDFCVRHGGGKRCKVDGCGKSAQGSTDFCKAHGGGRRCSWGHVGSSCSTGGPLCDRFARGKSGLCAAHSALVQDRCVHGGGTLAPPSAQHLTAIKPEKMQVVIEVDTLSENFGDSFSGSSSSFEQKTLVPPTIHLQSTSSSVPEGRVHGGSLMAMLVGGGTVIEDEPGNQVEAGAVEQEMQYPVAHSWM